MGCSATRPNLPKQVIVTETIITMKIAKLIQYAIIKQSKYMNENIQLELQLKQYLMNQQRDKNQEDLIYYKLSQNFRCQQTIDLIITYSKALKDYSYRIYKCKGQIKPVEDLMVYIQTIIFASTKLNMDGAQEFNQYFLFYFNLNPNNLLSIDQQIINIHQNLIPTEQEKCKQAEIFAKKYGFSLMQINQTGHQFQFCDEIYQQKIHQNQIDSPPQNMNIENENENENNNQQQCEFLQNQNECNSKVISNYGFDVQQSFNQELKKDTFSFKTGYEGNSSNPYHEIKKGLNNDPSITYNIPSKYQPQKPNIQLTQNKKIQQQNDN